MKNSLKELYYDAHASLLISKVNPDDVFYAHVLSMLKLDIGKDENLPCGVAFVKDEYRLTIHPGFERLSSEQKRFRLKEQALHVLFKHIPRQGEREKKQWDVASDLSIHQLITHASPDEKAIFPEMLGFERKQTAETYYAWLQQEGEDQQKSESGEGKDGKGEKNPKGKGKPNLDDRGDDHGGWGKGNGDPESGEGGQGEYDAQMMEEMADELSERISEMAMQKSRGLVSSDLNENLNIYKRKRKLDWKKYLKASLNKKAKGRKSTWKRVNRRFPDDYSVKGYTRKHSNNVTIAVDVSGSMSNEEVATGLAEVLNLCKQMNCKTNLIQIDTEIKAVQKFDARTMKFGRKGMGGTYMWDGMQYIIDNPNMNPDTVILITDGMIENSWPQVPPFRVIFLIVGKGNRLELNTSGLDCRVFHLNEN